MNIRKQLDVLKRRGTLRGNMREVNKAADVIFDEISSLVKVGQLDADFHLKLERVLGEMDAAMTPDPKGNIGNIGRDKLKEFADRNTISEKPNEEKIIGTIASKVLGGNDD